jgi:hypothetical protein
MNDTTFVEGGTVNENPYLIAQLSDNNGIDLSGKESSLITATLDGDTTYNLTTYFVSEKDNFQKGSIAFQLFNLIEGNHQIEFTIFDLLGNKSTATIQFRVGEQNSLVVSKLFGWPNPFSERVTIGFFQNRSGEDLMGTLTITNALGEPIRHIEFNSSVSLFSTEIMEWDGTDTKGSKLPAGIYILRLAVRSQQDGSKSESFAKLVLSN